MSDELIDQTIALSAVLQSALLVNDIATKGYANTHYVKPLMDSLFVENPKNALEIYGSLSSIELGIDKMAGSFLKTMPQQSLKYFNTLLILQKKIRQTPELMTLLNAGIESVIQKRDFYDNAEDNLFYVLNDIYVQTISKLQPRVQLIGNADYLSDTFKAAQIRSLLLAGIRAGILWSQCKGTRLNLIFNIKKIMQTAKDLKTL